MVVVAVAGAHTREIWSRLPLEIAVAIEDRCRGWGHLEWALMFVFLILDAGVGGWTVDVCIACPANTVQATFQGIRQ